MLKLLLVTMLSNGPSNAQLQRFSGGTNGWQPMGPAIHVVIGRHGLVDAAHKVEGDGKTPTGLFALGPDFGFASSTVTINKNTVCVDDVQSKYYGQIVNQAKIAHPDWHSAEQMYAQPLYRHGIAIQTPGAGSCIFLHIWQGPNQATAGCIAMSEADMTMLSAWLQGNKNAMIFIDGTTH